MFVVVFAAAGGRVDVADVVNRTDASVSYLGVAHVIQRRDGRPELLAVVAQHLQLVEPRAVAQAAVGHALTDAEVAMIKRSAEGYVQKIRIYLEPGAA